VCWALVAEIAHDSGALVRDSITQALAAASASTTQRVGMHRNLLHQGFGVSGAAYDTGALQF